jgi:hypothetical protein
MSMFYPLVDSTKESRRDIVLLLKAGLEKLASQLPCLAATAALDPVSKRGTLKTTGSDDGVLFLVTGADAIRTDLPSFAELERERFGPWKLPKGKTYPEALINPVTSIQGHDSALPGCIFQLNFIEGGAILTAAFHHYVADGPSVDHIFRGWGAQCQGRSIPLFTDRTLLISPKPSDPSKIPELERAMTARGCMVDSTKPDPDNPWSNLMGEPTKTAIISFPRKAVAALKADVAVQRSSVKVSTHDCLHAICWAGLVRAKVALGVDTEAKDSWTVFPVSFRSSYNPGFPKNFIGNGTLLNGAVLSIEKLKASEGSIDAAVALRNVVKNVDAGYVEDAMAWLSSIEEPSTRTWMTSPPRKMDVGLTSWACLNYHTWDFGFGPATSLRPPASPIPFVFPLPGKTDNDGEEVFEVAIAATEKAHKLLMKDVEFQRYVKDYYLEP